MDGIKTISRHNASARRGVQHGRARGIIEQPGRLVPMKRRLIVDAALCRRAVIFEKTYELNEGEQYWHTMSGVNKNKLTVYSIGSSS